MSTADLSSVSMPDIKRRGVFAAVWDHQALFYKCFSHNIAFYTWVNNIYLIVHDKLQKSLFWGAVAHVRFISFVFWLFV